jgi:hypothetical protein
MQVDRERQERNRKEDRQRQEQVIKQFREDVEKMREGLVEKCEERAKKMVTDLSHLERKTEQSIAEMKGEIQNLELTQSQRMSEVRASHAEVVAELVEYKRGVESNVTALRKELNKFKNEGLDTVSRDSRTRLGEGATAEAGTGALPPPDSQIDDSGGRVLTGSSLLTEGQKGSDIRLADVIEREVKLSYPKVMVIIIVLALMM